MFHIPCASVISPPYPVLPRLFPDVLLPWQNILDFVARSAALPARCTGTPARGQLLEKRSQHFLWRQFQSPLSASSSRVPPVPYHHMPLIDTIGHGEERHIHLRILCLLAPLTLDQFCLSVMGLLRLEFCQPREYYCYAPVITAMHRCMAVMLAVWLHLVYSIGHTPYLRLPHIPHMYPACTFAGLIRLLLLECTYSGTLHPDSSQTMIKCGAAAAAWRTRAPPWFTYVGGSSGSCSYPCTRCDIILMEADSHASND